ncbi:major tail protein [Cohnella lubricantis]|uniref:Phage tail protein n=1 Tax=Cohnella lubricantis TaxID=2163172 RepID=A0A841T879_9BACL|nr:major tail protein [Cohnella lubricantis]MBB6677524.1 hypothetical protein [Cohnella lubricantis]MBP2116590.1 phi13 family phage major tail protein [Cohnella lubricantis]
MADAAKKILKGLKKIQIFPITANTATAYTASAGMLVPGAQSLTLDPDVSEWTVNADDEVYDAGADWNGMKLTFQVAELSLELKSHLEGGTWDETAKEYDYSSNTVAPEIGLSFAARTSDGEYRMVKLWVLKVTKIKGEYKTKGGSGDSSSPVSVEATVMSRTIDGKVKREKDSVGGDLAWLNDLNDTPEV